MAQVENAPENCVACGLYEKCQSYRIAAEAPADLDVLFVEGFPGDMEDAQGKPAVSASGRFLRFAASFMKYSVGFTHAVRCRPESNKVSLMQVEACREFLVEEVKRLNPKVIVALGGTPLQSLWPDAPSVTSAIARPQKIGSRWLLAAYAPSNHTSGRKDLREEYAALMGTIDRIMQGLPPQTVQEVDIRIVERDNISQALSDIAQASHIFFDTEENTYSDKRSPEKATMYMDGRKILCLGTATTPENPVWVWPAAAIPRLLPHLKSKTLVAHNILHDIVSVGWFFPEFRHLIDNPMEDTFLMHTALDQGFVENSLEGLAVKYLRVPRWKHIGWDPVHEETTRRSAARQIKELGVATLEDIPFQTLALYNGYDCHRDMLLYHELVKTQKIPAVYQDFLIPMVRMLARVQLRGIGASKERLEAITTAVEAKVAELEESLYRAEEVCRIASDNETKTKVYSFNPGSGPQLDRLMRLMGVEAPTTDTGLFSTSKEVLSQLAEDNSLWRRIHRVRQYRGLLSKFLWPTKYHIARDGRIHTSYKAGKASTSEAGEGEGGGTVTGRISSSAPALHNYKKDPLIRSLFLPRPGYLAAEFDFKSAEVVVEAWLTGCKSLIGMFERGEDPYVFLACMVWKLRPEDVTKDIRTKAKTHFLAKMYGELLENFCSRTKTALSEGRRFYEYFENEFPEIVKVNRIIEARVRDGRPILTPWGRQRFFTLRELGEAFNYVPQSSSSDLTVYKAMLSDGSIPSEWKEPEHEIALVNLVHDSHWAEILESDADWIISRHVRLMEDPTNLPFEGFPPILRVDVKVGPHFGKMEAWASKVERSFA